MFPIVEKQLLAPSIARLVIRAPLIAPKRKAGNFVIVRATESGERIPLTIVDSDPGQETITLIVQAVGKTTRLMLAMHPGEALLDVAGPLGNPTELVENSVVACIGGGVGTAVMLPITRALKAAGNDVYSIVGARSKDLIILEDEMKACSDHFFLTTDDGSYVRKGLVTDALRELIEIGVQFDAVYAIGPLPMMKAVAAVTKKFGIHTLVSLNTIMVDGTGMCGGCRVTIDHKMKFACVDGPEFDAHQVDFDELMMRNKTYVEMEKESLERFHGRKN
jgi:ferredoxin--NADP+ reductase